ncbi:MAG TPA: DNA translocase FtsK, partial [Desulfobacteraceae bacterium]|nr:DNA translocase FtsK [Desulfobacteraceae bacterium]
MPLPQNKKSPFRDEIIALFTLFLAVFLLLCLVSYSLPLLGEQPALQSPQDNWCGTLGFYIAHNLFSFFGLTAFFPVLILVYSSVAAMVPGSSGNRLPFLVAGISGILLSASGLFAIARQLVFPTEFLKPGGYLGELIWRLLSRFIGSAGSLLLLLLILTFSLMAAVRFSPVGTLKWLCKAITSLGKKFPKKVSAPKKTVTAAVRTEPKVAESTSAPVRKEESVPAVHEPVAIEQVDDADDSRFAVRPARAGDYRLPTLSLLDRHDQQDVGIDKDHYYQVSQILISKLEDFGVSGKVTGISPGPVVTTYEYAPAPGVKINKIVSLADDLALALKVNRVRIVGSIPGKAALGIEIPNPKRKTVYLRDILATEKYRDSKSRLSLALGLDVVGRPVVADITRMPHLLIAGATGAGKSVAINAFIASIL